MASSRPTESTQSSQRMRFAVIGLSALIGISSWFSDAASVRAVEPAASPEVSPAAPEPSVTPQPAAPPASGEPETVPPPDEPVVVPDPKSDPELIDRRTATTRSWDVGNGQVTSELFPSPIFYQPNGEGDYVPIELDFEATADGRASVTTSPTIVTVDGRSDDSPVLSLTSADGFIIGYTPLLPDGIERQAHAPALTGSVADLAEILPGVDLRVSARSDGANVWLVLAEAPADPRWTFVLDVPVDTMLRLDDDGAIDVIDAAGEIRARIAAPYAIDSTPDERMGSGRMTNKLHYEVDTAADGRPTVTTVLDDAEWLASAVYPIYVDPSTTLVGPGSDTYGDTFINQGNVNQNYANYQRPDSPTFYEMWLGESPTDSTYKNTALIKFDISSILGYAIDAAELRIRPYHAYYDAPTERGVWAYRIGSTWTESGVKWSNKPSWTTNSTTTTCAEAATLSCVLDASYWTRVWVNGLETNYGLAVDTDGNNATYWKRLIAAEQVHSTSPRLYVTYHDPVTAVSPTGGVKVGSRSLAWTYDDIYAGTGQGKFRVEVSTDNFATTPVLVTSGDVTGTPGQARSWAIPTSTALTPGATYYWRVKVGIGAVATWSPWSAVGTFVWDPDVNLGMQSQHTFESWDLGAGDELAVNVATGNLVVSHPIASLPIQGSSLDIHLTYNSHDPTNVGIGPGWRLNVQRRLTVLGNGNVMVTDSDGARHTFTYNAGTYTRPADLYATLTRNTAATPDRFTLTYRDQSQDLFDELVTNTGYLVREQDRYGNGVNLGYVGTELRTITDAAPSTARVIDLTWTAGKLTQIQDWAYVNSAGEVQTSATGSRRTTRFFYDGSNRLSGWADPFSPTGSCPTGGSHATCLDYATGLTVAKTQTYMTVNSGNLETATPRPVATVVTMNAADVTLVKHAAESTGTAFSRPSSTEVEVLRKGSGTSQDTKVKYARLSTSEPYARIGTASRWDGAAWLATTTAFDATYPIEPASTTEDAGGALSRTTTFTYVASSMGLVSRIVEPVTTTDERWTDHTYNGTNDLLTQTVSFEGASPVVTAYTFAAGSCSTNALLILQCATIANYFDGNHVGGTLGHLRDVTTNFTYDAFGQRLTETRHNYLEGDTLPMDERVDTWTYDDKGNVTSSIVNRADGAVTGGSDVTPSGTPPARTDLITTYTYDTAGNQVSVADPRRLIFDVAGTPGVDDYLSTTVYDAFSEAVSVEAPTTPTSMFGVACSPDPACRLTITKYDELGSAREAVDTDGTVTATVYDEAGRSLQTWEDIDGTGGTAARQTSLQSFDPQGRTLTSKDDRQLDDANLGQTKTTYNILGLTTDVKVADGLPTADDSTTRTTYDRLDRVATETSGIESGYAQTTTTSYDKGGRVVSVDDEFTCTTTAYDHRDLPTSIVEGKASGLPCTGAGTRTITLTHDALGRLLTRTTGSTTLEANAYDSAGNVRKTSSTELTKLRVAETIPNLLDEPLETQAYLKDGAIISEQTWSRTTRDGAGNETDRCTWTTAPNEWCHAASDTSWVSPVPISRSSTSYDARNQRVRSFVPGKGETTYDPTANYQVDKVYTTTRTNGTDQVVAEHVADHGYDSRDRLITISQQGCIVTADTHTCTSTPVVSGSTAYEYDDAGNRTKVIEDNGSGAVTRYYCYDARNQLIKVSTASGCPSTIETYTYDAAGNRTGDGTRGFLYTTKGQLASCTTVLCGTPAFDADGRLTSITTTVGGTQAWTYQYDAESRLTTACKASSCTGTPAKLAFTYDGEGRRIRIVETPAGTSPTVTTTDFAYEGDTVVRETATTGTTVITRTFTTDEQGAIVKMTVATTPTAGADDGTYIIAWNGHGDAISLAEIDPGTGALTPAARITYSTWGKPDVLAQAGYGALGFRYLYVGRFDVQWDDFGGAGLLYMQTRHYSPEFGRFLQPDPTAAEANLYGYAGNGPVTRVDPDGRLFWFVAIAVAVARVVVPRIIRVLPRLGVVTRATRQAVPRARAVFQRYSDHALDRMSQHGVSRAMVEKTIQRGVCFFDPLHRSLVFVIQLQRHWLGVAIDPYSRKIITILWDDTRKGVVKTRFLQGRYPCP